MKIEYVYSKIMDAKNRRFKFSWENEKMFMDSLGTPKTDIDRSYYQYKCQRKLMGTLKAILWDSISVLMIIPTIIIFFLMNVNLPTKEQKKGVITLTRFTEEHMLPNDLNEYAPFGVLRRECGRLTLGDFFFVCKMMAMYPFSPFFQFKCIWMIAAYSYAIYKFEPQVIIASAEYSFTSSVLTMYCEKHGIKHYNVMHGDKILSIRDSFFRFSRFFVWDVHYINLFKKMKAMSCDLDFTVFHCFTPIINVNPNVLMAKYYLQIHTKKQLETIRNSLEKFGMEYKVRPHPRHNNKDIYDVFDEGHIEKVSDVPIDKSLERASVVIAEDSTVLYQAYLLGIPIAIDDITNPSYIHELKSREYIMLQKTHNRLSKMIARSKALGE